MPNPYYTFTDTFVPGARARSGDIDRELQAVENAFDNLPATADALTRGVATFTTETGSGNAYVVAMPNTRTTNQDGDEVIFFATHGNTGDTTLNVDGIGAVSLRDRTGAQIASGGITNGRLYSMRPLMSSQMLWMWCKDQLLMIQQRRERLMLI
jgi:hypothetical protein